MVVQKAQTIRKFARTKNKWDCVTSIANNTPKRNEKPTAKDGNCSLTESLKTN